MLKKLAGETVIYGLSSIIGRMVTFLLTPLYTYNFPTEDYGVVIYLYSLVAFLMVIFIYRMESAYFRFGTDAETRESAFSTALLSVVSTSVIFAGIMLFFSRFIAVDLMNYPPSYALYVSMFAGILAFDVIAEIPFARLRLEGKALRFAILKLTSIGVNVGLNLFFIVLCPWILEQGAGHFAYDFIEKIYNPTFGVGYIFVANLAASSLVLLLLIPDFLRTKYTFDPALWRKMFVWAAPLILAGLAGIANEVIDRVMLKYLLPENIADSELGIYGACYKLAVIMALFTQAFRYAAEPFFFAQKKNKDSKELYAAIGKYFAVVGLVAFLVVTFYIDLFQYLVDEPYREGLKIVPVLLLANLFLGLYYNLSVWYKLTDKTRWGGYIMAVGAVITVVLNWWWIPKIGYMGSAWATLICYVSVTAISYVLGQKYFPVPYDLKRIFGYIFIAVAFYFLSLWMRNAVGGDLTSVLISNTALLLLYFVILFQAERKLLRKFFA